MNISPSVMVKDDISQWAGRPFTFLDTFLSLPCRSKRGGTMKMHKAFFAR